MTGCLPSRPARDHRAARNQARWLTEVGRLRLAQGDNPAKTPLYILRGLEKGKRQPENEKIFGVAQVRIRTLLTDQSLPGLPGLGRPSDGPLILVQPQPGGGGEVGTGPKEVRLRGLFCAVFPPAHRTSIMAQPRRCWMPRSFTKTAL